MSTYFYCDTRFCSDENGYCDVECPGFDIPAGTWSSQDEYEAFAEKLYMQHRPTCPCGNRGGAI